MTRGSKDRRDYQQGCLVLKITRRTGGSRVCRNITVTNCVLATRETALKIGSETYGEFRNITVAFASGADSAGLYQSGNRLGGG